MSNILDTLSNIIRTGEPGRELSTGVWVSFIENATGQKPIVKTVNGVNVIYWQQGQAAKMKNFFDRQLKNANNPSKKGGPGSMGLDKVSIDWRPVFIPLAVQKLWLPISIYTVALILISKKIGK